MPPRPRLSTYSRQRIKVLLENGASTSDIVSTLRREGVVTCRQTVWRFQCHMQRHQCIAPLPKSGRKTKLTERALQCIENCMRKDDETTGKELVQAVTQTVLSVTISTTTALKGRRLLGWTRRGTAYCQLIRVPNRAKRLEWAQRNIGRSFEDVIWSDETSVQKKCGIRNCG